MISGENKFLTIDQRRRAPGVARLGDDYDVRGELPRSSARQFPLSGVHRPPRIGFMNNPFTTEVLVKLLVIWDIVMMREKHETQAAQLFELAHQRLGEARRVDQNISRLALDEIAMGAETVGRREAAVINIVIESLRQRVNGSGQVVLRSCAMEPAGQLTNVISAWSSSASDGGCLTTTGRLGPSPKMVGASCRQVGQLMQLRSTKKSPGALAGSASSTFAMSWPACQLTSGG